MSRPSLITWRWLAWCVVAGSGVVALTPAASGSPSTTAPRIEVITYDGVINAEGEFPTTLQLRFLQTLREIASEKTSTMILPVPIDLLTPFIKREP